MRPLCPHYLCMMAWSDPPCSAESKSDTIEVNRAASTQVPFPLYMSPESVDQCSMNDDHAHTHLQVLALMVLAF
jgi:hypothetical protein